MLVQPSAVNNGMELKDSASVETSNLRKKGHGSVMSFHNISYTVDVKPTCCGSCRNGVKRYILKDVSGIMKPGLNAIMGPTGSGKSSLLDVLASRKDPSQVSGEVLLDGKSIPKNFHYISGYVIQNDLLVGTMSVKETLWFCANLRLPTSISHKEKKSRIESVISELGLASCANTKIGTDIIRGISGGEKKRTSIALELILEPQILFLDEPTTGLDAATARSVMRLLKKLGNQGNTIVCSIHQPRYAIYKLFDTLTLLAGGNLLYHGENNLALEHFERQGYTCEPHDNPADFFLDVLNGEYDDGPGGNEIESGAIVELTSDDFETVVSTVDVQTKFLEAYKTSDQFRTVSEELAKIRSASQKVKLQSGVMYATSFLHQLGVLIGRTAKDVVRNPQGLIGNVVLNVIIGVVFGLIYFQVDNSPDAGIQNRLGILFFICTNLLFGSVSAVDIFKAEREIFIHEYISGYYRIISYFLAKVLADLIPLRTIAPIILCSITYWMVGMRADPGAFFIFLLASVLVGYASVGIGLFYSASFSKAISELCLILTFVFTIIFSGLLVNVDSILPWLGWLEYLSVARYGLVALSINELRGQTFSACGPANDSSAGSTTFGSGVSVEITRPDNETICTSVQGEVYLHNSLSVGASAEDIGDWDLWQNIVALGVIVVGIYTLTYIQLIRIRKYS